MIPFLTFALGVSKLLITQKKDDSQHVRYVKLKELIKKSLATLVKTTHTFLRLIRNTYAKSV